MFWTMSDANSWNLASGSPGSRFSTLNVPIEITSGWTMGDVTSRVSPLSSPAGVAVGRSSKLLKL